MSTFIVSGVHISADVMKSPSFSRSSSSTTMTIRPWRNCSTACSMVLNSMTLRLEQLLDVTGNEVHLDVHLIAHAPAWQVRMVERVRDDPDGEPIGAHIHQREADPIHRDGALGDHIAHQFGR